MRMLPLRGIEGEGNMRDGVNDGGRMATQLNSDAKVIRVGTLEGKPVYGGEL